MLRAVSRRTTSGTLLTRCEHSAVMGADSAERVWRRRRIAKATGATMVLTLADMDGNESFDPSLLGAAEEVSAAVVASSTLQLLGCFCTAATWTELHNELSRTIRRSSSSLRMFAACLSARLTSH